jgi:hypothetical protein
MEGFAAMPVQRNSLDVSFAAGSFIAGELSLNQLCDGSYNHSTRRSPPGWEQQQEGGVVPSPGAPPRVVASVPALVGPRGGL